MASQLHLIMIPLMAPGHIIPMIDMAKLLAKRGLTVTIIVTPLTAARFGARAVGSGLSIRLVQVRFPAEEAGLPPGCETVDCLPSYNLIPNFHLAISLLQRPIEQSLANLPAPDCIICDKHIPWTADTCEKLEIPRIIFDGMSCFAQLIIHRLYDSKAHEKNPDQVFAVPGLPDRIEFSKRQLPGMFNPGSLDLSYTRARIRETERLAHGVVVNSFDELERGGYVDEYRKVRGGKLWCIGPLSLSVDNSLVDKGSVQCLKWLDSREPGSVVYACLGSLSRLSRLQFTELALGLELSGHPFILVVKEGDDKGIQKWIAEEGFEEVTRERGVVIRGWAPQVAILSHPSVGGFLTHCGWNSTLEGISAGVPLVTWPLFAEQFLNEKLAVEVLRTGVGVGAKAVVQMGEEEKAENKVGRDEIKAAIQSVMDGGEEGMERRKRAQELGETAKKAVQEKGSSYHNVELLIQEISQFRKIS